MPGVRTKKEPDNLSLALTFSSHGTISDALWVVDHMSKEGGEEGVKVPSVDGLVSLS